MKTISVALVDDHLLFRKSLSLLISSFTGIEVVIEVENGKELLLRMESANIDVVLLDLQMPVMDGYQTCQKIKEFYPSCLIIVVSQLSSKESIHQMMELGAHGYFTKNSNPEHLEQAIRSVYEEGFYFASELGSVIKEVFLWDTKNPKTAKNQKQLFSEREIQIIKMICKEYKSKEIAEKLYINVRTVESHRKHVMEKCDAKNIIGVIIYALKNGIVEVDDL